MLKIQIHNHNLVLYQDTSVNIELNNSMFADDFVLGDVVYTFNIPVRGNEISLEFGHDPHSVSGKKFQCLLFYNGIELFNGMLHIQKAGQTAMMVAIVINPYPDKFSERSLRTDESDTVTISSDETTHVENWKHFLENTIGSDKDFKFAPFLNNKGYGNADNTAIGKLDGFNILPVINRMFFDVNNQVNTIEFPKVFSLEDGIEQNQFCFCPQFRLLYVLNKIAESAGYKLSGNIFTNEDFKQLYIQSARALDEPGGIGLDNIYLHASSITDSGTSAGTIGLSNSNDTDPNSLLSGYGLVRFTQPGKYKVKFSKRLTVNTYDMHVVFTISAITNPTNPYAADNHTTDPILYRKDLGNYQVAQASYNINEETTIEVRDDAVNVPILFGIWKNTYGSDGAMSSAALDNYFATLEIDADFTEYNQSLNGFARKFKLSDFFPDVENGKFLTSIIKDLGIALFIDHKTKVMEMSFCEDILTSKTLDLSKWELTRKTEIEIPETNPFAFKLTPLSNDNQVDYSIYIGEFKTAYDVYDHCHFVLNVDEPTDMPITAFVTTLNGFYSWGKRENPDYDPNLNGSEQEITDLVCYSQNNRLLTFPATITQEKAVDITDIENTTIKIPGIRGNVHWEKLTNEDRYNVFALQEIEAHSPIRYFSEIHVEIESYLNPKSRLKDIILMKYDGVISDVDGNGIYTERMLPVSKDITIAPNGEKSWGEKYIRKWYKLKKQHRTLTYRFLLPFTKLMEVINLIRPQASSPSQQIRAIIVNNVKSWPIKISFQLEGDSDIVLTEIVAAAEL